MATRSGGESGGMGGREQQTSRPQSPAQSAGPHEEFAGAGQLDDTESRGSSMRTQSADLKERAARGVRELGAKAQTTARERLEARKRDAAYTLTSVASTLLSSGSQLRDDEQFVAGDYVERAARQVERAANYVQNVELGELVDNVEDFARKRPAVFVGAAFALGILAARFLKSTREPGTTVTDRQVPTPLAYERSVPVARSDERLEQPL